MASCSSCWHLSQRQLPASTSSLHQSLWHANRSVHRLSSAQHISKCTIHIRPGTSTLRRGPILTQATAKPTSQRAGPERTNFFTKLIRPLRDFGLGKSSLMEGGVGLFIFAGIGMLIKDFYYSMPGAKVVWYVHTSLLQALY